jgi:DNA-binding NarL/FixJ family response regulator
MGDREGAQSELQAALDVFRSLGAVPDATRTEVLLRSVSKSRDGHLTARQVEVLQLVAQGLTNPEIASTMNLSERTVDRHVSDILARLEVPTRAAATAYAFAHGLIANMQSG